MTVLGHQRGEDAFAQAPVGHAQALAGPYPEQGLEDGAAGEHEIGALLADARLRHALGIAHGDQAVGDGAHIRRAEPAAVDAGAVVGGKAEMNAGDGGDGSGGAEEMRARIGDAAAETVRALEIGQRPRHVRHHGLVILAADLAAAMALGEADHADRQRRPGGDAALHFEPVVDGAAPGTIELGEIEPDQLRAAAADIEDERPIAIAVDQRGAARDGELRLGLAAHDLDGKTGLAAHAVDELAAVGGDPARLGGDQARARHAAPPHLVGADLERLDGAAHGGIGEMAGAQHAFAEANDAGEGVDDEKAAARRPCDQQPAIVGAEIESPVDRNCGAPRARTRIVLALGCPQ